MEVVNYLIIPFDLIPEEEYGCYGYLDDALISLELIAYIEDGVTQFELTNLIHPSQEAYIKILKNSLLMFDLEFLQKSIALPKQEKSLHASQGSTAIDVELYHVEQGQPIQ